MEIPLAVVADYSNVRKEGKLNIMGIFAKVNAPTLPFILSKMHCVFNLRYGPTERGMKKKLSISLVDDDGGSLLQLNTEFEIPADSPPSGDSYQMVGLAGLQFAKYGDYAFHISVNDEPKARVAFSVVEPESPSPGEPAAPR